MRALYTAATGLLAQQTRIDNIANNLANVSTTGFKKTTEVFEDLMAQQEPVGSPSQETVRPNLLEIGTGTRIVATTRNFAEGNLSATGNALDVAIDGPGFFIVEMEDGEPRYTRDGHFQINRDGEIVTNAGYRVSPGIQIPDDAYAIRIAEDGTVSASYENSTEEVSLGTLEMVDFVNAAGLRSVGGNLYTETPESGEPRYLDSTSNTKVRQGFLEASNVDVAEELVAMISAQRAYELNSKVIQTADDALRVVTALKQ